jgi:hypothetical protein
MLDAPAANRYQPLMETPSPYHTSQTQMPAQSPDVILREPGAIKVFGVLHLVIAGYSIFTEAINLVINIFFPDLARSLSKPRGISAPSSAEQEMALIHYMNEVKTYSYSSTAFSFILAIMLIVAGIGLLKGRVNGRVMSLRYAWISLVTKIVSFIIAIAVVMPATKRMAEALYQNLPGTYSQTMVDLMQYSPLIVILISCVYPIIVLVVMKGQKIKEYMAARAAF